ncbi:MAG TPA: maleylpyruvate isomerase N-terminal domain-containing protein [Propionibacteriaceae bacterium]|nr:maleylpyruvate isomerase N-terminal domain-containing protein [Propionibacteriaceae bacterium]
MSPAEHFSTAANSYAELVGRLPADGWDRPGLGDWDLRALVGHASRSLITVDSYLDQPATAEDVRSPEDYYAVAATIVAADPAAVVERGRQAGLGLGDDPAVAVRQLVDRVVPRLAAVDGDPLIFTIAGGMRLSSYLPTRVFELVVHSLDIAAATGLDLTLPAEPLAEAIALAGRIAVAAGRGPTALLALTGRASLPAGFSVV